PPSSPPARLRMTIRERLGEGAAADSSPSAPAFSRHSARHDNMWQILSRHFRGEALEEPCREVAGGGCEGLEAPAGGRRGNRSRAVVRGQKSQEGAEGSLPGHSCCRFGQVFAADGIEFFVFDEAGYRFS